MVITYKSVGVARESFEVRPNNVFGIPIQIPFAYLTSNPVTSVTEHQTPEDTTLLKSLPQCLDVVLVGVVIYVEMASRHLPTNMNASTGLDTKRDERSSQSVQAMSDVTEHTADEVSRWNTHKLLEWIQQKLPIPLQYEDTEVFLKMGVDGYHFSNHAGDRDFFMGAGISYLGADKLAILSKEVTSGKSKYCRH